MVMKKYGGEDGDDNEALVILVTVDARRKNPTRSQKLYPDIFYVI
jgi:hypothetical protein